MTSRADYLSDRAELSKLEAFTAGFAAQSGISPADLFAVQIIVEELVTNVIHYGGVPAGQPACTVTLTAEDGELVVVIRDCGHAYNPLSRDEPDVTLPAEKRPIGGLGIHFCKKLSDAQDYRREDGWNVLTLRRKLTA